MPKRDLNALVNGAGGDISEPGAMRRGRGLEGMLSSEPAPVPPTSEAASHFVNNETSLQAAPSAAPSAVPLRKVVSYRITPELARRVKIYAAIHDLNDYEVVEAALAAYLDRAGERGEA